MNDDKNNFDYSDFDGNDKLNKETNHEPNQENPEAYEQNPIYDKNIGENDKSTVHGYVDENNEVHYQSKENSQTDDRWKTVYVNENTGFDGQKKPKKDKSFVTKKTLVVSLIFCIIFSTVLGGVGFMAASKYFGSSIYDRTIKTTHYSLSKATGSELSIQEIIAKNENSVVAISTESVSTDSWMGQYVTNGAGSGVIYSEDGYIITNNHVISGASSVKVTLHNGKEYQASLIANDPQTDIAILKINETGLTPVSAGDIKTANVGDLAVVIGNPLGKLAGSATEGIISALGREITIDGKAMTLIQTSASVNPGNSGGGLFDQYGNLLGIVVAKSSGSEIEGLGFAIPIDKVLSIADSLIKNGYVEGRPALGVNIVDLSDASRAMQAGVSVTGVYIQDVVGNNAKKAGLKPGDMIYYIEDERVTDSGMLLKRIQSHKIGDTINITVLRNNDILKMSIKLEDASKINNMAKAG